MILISSIRVDYGHKRAFSNFSLNVSSGEMVSIIGTSGCGKTSLLYAISGLLTVSGGRIELQGGRKACSIMFQQDRLLPWKNLTGNVLIGLGKDKRAEAESLLESFGLSGQLNRYPDELSGGERQRAALARCLIRRPKLLLLDEPLASLDEQTRERLQEEIKTYVREHGITMLLVTHSIQEAVFMGSRIIVMTPNGISFEILNPDHACQNLRSLDSFYTLEKQLRKALQGNRRDYP